MTPQEYFEQISIKREQYEAARAEGAVDSKPNTKIVKLLEVTQEINDLYSELWRLKLKYGTKEGYEVAKEGVGHP